MGVCGLLAVVFALRGEVFLEIPRERVHLLVES